MGVLEAYAADPSEGQVNLLYLSVGDEESLFTWDAGSFGPPLTDLQEKFDLNYVVAVDSEPFESEVEERKGPSHWHSRQTHASRCGARRLVPYEGALLKGSMPCPS